MIFWQLFWAFLKIGCFSFGGAYGAIPLVRDAVLENGWLTEDSLAYMIAVSESTPGPIMINMATYVGSCQAGIPGALLATFAVVLPAFIIILLIATLLRHALKMPAVQAVLRGMTPCVIGIVLATGIVMVLEGCLADLRGSTPDLRALLITVLLGSIFFFVKYVLKKKFSSISLILVSAAAGAVLYSL